MGLDQELPVLQERVQGAREQLRTLHQASKPAIERLATAVATVTDSWSGSCAGYHGRLYYRNFERPPLEEAFSIEWGALHGLPDGWEERTADEVLTAIETLAGAKISEVEQGANGIAPELESLQQDLAVTLAPIRRVPMLSAETKRLDALEQMPLRVRLNEYVKANLPGIRTRDTEAALQGFTIPAHLYYDGQIAEAKSVFEKGLEFLQAADRLVRQARAQLQFTTGRPVSRGEGLARVIKLCKRFPLIVGQLQNRQRNRAAFEVKDEYDVQDLFHALLLLDFDDVRREEHAPSHAGSAPSIDFLLKAEQIVIETKMTRGSLTAKVLGDELLADIGRYAEHPNAKKLVCFVYDPRQQLVNPRGLEGDLMKHSRDDLEVVVIIAPR